MNHVALVATALVGSLGLVLGSAGAPPPDREAAVFAGGCFWCMQPAFDALPGVVRTTVGYTGGHVADPTYEQVSAGGTGHVEAIEIEYDPATISYAKLLDVFWHNVDPTDPSGQFCDRGPQYTSEIFVADDAQRVAAERSKAEIERTKPFAAPIVTRIVAAGKFWPAEDYHQDYYRKNPLRYKYYRWGCGRDARLKELWGAASGGH
jgi:peptide-methionine (S)-S-oxide reductase